MILGVLLTTSLFSQQNNWNNEIYQNAGEIVIRDLILLKYGITKDKDACCVHLDLTDLIKRYGRVCPGIGGAFMISKISLENLYEENEIPEKGEIKMTTCSQDELYQKVAEILRLDSDARHGKKT